MPLQIEINSNFAKVLNLVENTTDHIFITGNAGTGKSTLLNLICETTKKNFAVIAPTGVSALNVKGQTIHKFFSFPINITPDKIYDFEFMPRSKRIYKQLQTLIIDEVSMLRADIFDCIDAFLQLYGPNPEKAFGGVQLILVGDLLQLPPVVSNIEKSYFSKKYLTPYFFSSIAFKKINIKTIELTKIYRQKDKLFIDILGRIRNNKATSNDLSIINTRASEQLDITNDFVITLTTTNSMADDINRLKLKDLCGSIYVSQATVEGKFGAEYFPTSELLEFKEGAQIMFLNNDTKKRWVNGSLGKIEKINYGKNKVRYLSVRLQKNAQLVDVFPYTWEVFKYSLLGSEIVSEVVGSYTQFPIRLAWAVTIHKSQGQTFDKICIDIGRGTFATGQLYVALSRCTSMQGVFLKKMLSDKHILCDEQVICFLQDQMPIHNSIQKDKKLREAIVSRKKLLIKYQKPDLQISQRVIIPINIKGKNLLAFCTSKQEQRSFNIERILEIENFND